MYSLQTYKIQTVYKHTHTHQFRMVGIYAIKPDPGSSREKKIPLHSYSVFPFFLVFVHRTKKNNRPGKMIETKPNAAAAAIVRLTQQSPKSKRKKKQKKNQSIGFYQSHSSWVVFFCFESFVILSWDCLSLPYRINDVDEKQVRRFSLILFGLVFAYLNNLT